VTYDYGTDVLDVDRECVVTVHFTPAEVGVTVRHMLLIEYATAEGTFQAGAVRVFSGQ
jgi:hypothetical protein